MMTARPTGGPRRFSGFEFRPETGELFRGGAAVALQRQPAQVLELLTRTPGRLVTREELRQAVWGDRVFVDFERSLNFCIRQIRRALGESAPAPRFIQTLPRRGYRFIASLELESSVSSRWLGRVEAAGRPRAWSWVLSVAAALALGLIGGSFSEHRMAGTSAHKQTVGWLHASLGIDPGRCPWGWQSGD
ncbi:MAG TPA: winged helix-turn-helix domain-containing protein [Acidobacteriota bacterium]